VTRLLALFWVLLALLAPSSALADGARPAHAEAPLVEPNATNPRDAPLVFEPTSAKIPKVPDEYTTRDLGWLRISFPPAAHERVEPLIRDADDVKARLAEVLGQPVLSHVDVRVARTAEEMVTLAPVNIPPPPYASGVAYNGLHLVLLTLSSPDPGSDAPDLEEVFRHEMVHVALEDAVLDHHVPLWFNEGLAIHESGELPLKRTKTLWDATLSKSIIPLAQLDQGFPRDRFEVNIAYAESGDFVRFLLRDADRARFGSMIERVRNGQPFERALTDAYATDLRKLEYQWREELAKKYTYLPLLTGGSLLWVIVLGAMVVGYVKRRRRAKATLARWEREEAALDAAVAEAQETDSLPIVVDAAASAAIQASGLPKIEHDGSWYTVH